VDEPAKVFEFKPTSAVATARTHNRFVVCPACRADHPSYLFHRAGVRFVRCTACGVVYVNPAREHPINYFDLDGAPVKLDARDRELLCDDFARLLDKVAADHQQIAGEPLVRTLLVGRYLPELALLPQAAAVGLEIAQIDDDKFQRLATASDISWIEPLPRPAPQVVILHELLEACIDLGAVVEKLVASLPESTLFVITYTNADSLPGRMMRRYWSSFFDYKAVFLATANLTALCARYGLVLKHQYPLPMTRSAGYIADKLSLPSPLLRDVKVPVRAGARVAVFGRAAREASHAEKLSIVLPVFNEARYAQQVIDAVLGKQLKIDREVIIVESNSTDGTREIVQRYEGQPGVKVVLEERPRGKGHAVRTGLQHVTGTIVLIQDADFEYDIDDYDALLEPILQRKAMFVLGSRSLGLDDWKVRRYDATPVRGLLLNFAQVMFAKTYNALYQQRVTDVNTMFKVFRTECLDGLDLHSNGFELDIELACKLARNGNSPMEVPVNYVARGFAEGKKIRFWRDAIPSYAAFFKYRFK
jgi:Zn ribbon nucleic-acid-binding protein